MRRSREEAAETRRRAVAAAARLFRAHGIDAVGLKEIMKAIGMTHGGFYRHFASKDALVAEAIAAASEDSGAALRGAAGRGVAAVVEQYLSPAHVENRERGCPVAALVSEAARQPASTRAAFTQAVEQTTGMLEEAKGGSAARRRKALFTFAALVGGVALARASADPDLAEEILAAVRDGLRG